MALRKIKSQSELFKVIDKVKKDGKKVVAINGSFDILHSGHIKDLQEAKNQGDILVVLLNSDKSIKSYKGPHRPLNKQTDRALVLSAIEYVDYIVLFDEINPIKILEKLKPDIFCQGADWGKNCIERETIENYSGTIYVLKWQQEKSTTKLVEKIRNLRPDVKAVFLDRDGTINKDLGYCYKIEDFQFTPYAIEALKKLSQSEYKIIIVTNQSGIGRGYYKEEDMNRLHNWMIEMFKEEGIRIDQIYYCPHKPEDNCECRKPDIGMLMKAVKEFGISLNKSWAIGDSEKDIIMARRANVNSIKLGKKMAKSLKLEPNHYANNLFEAVEIILSQKS